MTSDASSVPPQVVAHRWRLDIDISSPDPQTVVVTPLGAADSFTLSALAATLTGAVRTRRRLLIVDLDHWTFTDAGTLELLVAARREASAAGCLLHVRCLNPERRRLLMVTGLAGLLHHP